VTLPSLNPYRLTEDELEADVIAVERAARPIDSVIACEVFGLMTCSFI